MTAMPASKHSTVRAIYKLHEDRRGEPRGYLGASGLGDACLRRLWLSFRQAEIEAFDGRLLRLFETGNVQERRIIEELEAIGVRVEGTQAEVMRWGGHFKGHCDGVGQGFVEAPKAWHLMEIKTHNAKSFAALVKDGMGKSKPMHAAQMQVYMGEMGIDRGMYIAVNKDTDELFVERIHFDKEAHARLMDRAEAAIFTPEPPVKISEDPSWWECKFCPFHGQCHGQQVPRVSCRTCAHATPRLAGDWHCAHWDDAIPADVVNVGCDEHRYIPATVANTFEFKTADANVVTWLNKTNNATIRQPDYSSKEMRAATDKAFVGNDFANSMKREFPGTQIVASGNIPEGEAAIDVQSDLPWLTTETKPARKKAA